MTANHTAKEEDYENGNYKDTKEQNEDPPDYSNLTSFEDDNNSNQNKYWMSNIRRITCILTRYIELIVSK